MIRNSNFMSRLTSIKGIAAMSFVFAGLVLPACGVNEPNEGIYEEGVGEEELYEEEGIGEEGVYEEEGIGEEGVYEEEGIGE